MTQDDSKLSRRNVLKGTGAASTAALVGLAGCTGGNGTETGTGTKGGDQTPKQSALEIVHWWTAGGEKQALQALLDGFKKKYPDVEVKNNPAPGGAGSALDTVIKNRVLNENPPSTFQIWPGKALYPYTNANLLRDISSSVWGENDMKDAYLKGVKKAAKGGTENFVSVPINIHRLNNLFYNKKVVKSADVDPDSINDPNQLSNVLDKIADNTDKVPMAHQTKSPWSTLQLWETVFTGSQGVDAFNTFISGDVKSLEKEVKASLQRVKDYSEHFNSDAGSISWDQANSKVVNGEAAFIHQGDWAAGQYKAAEGFKYDTDWGQTSFPGTSGVYSLVMDSFVFPKNNPSPEATKKFLRYCGSVDAQKRFNPKKGSIPPRTDVPTDVFGPFLTDQINDFKGSNRQPTTIAHGTAVRPEIKSNIEGAFASFIENWNVKKTYDQLVSAFDV